VEIDQDPVSLDELARAFAQAMGTSPKEVAGPQPLAAAPVDGPHHRQPVGPELFPDEPAEDAGPVTPLGILEAMLFVGDRGNSPLTAARAAELMRGVEPDEVPALVQELNRRYAQNECPYYVSSNSDGYRLTLHKPFHALRERFFGRIRQARLSQAAIDTLAVVAYQQPLSAEQITAVRGRPSGHVLSQLVHRGLLRIERLPGKRRTAQYHTTDRFLKLFGLATLADLPQSEELERQ
jgi:segregation and condensation protein B